MAVFLFPSASLVGLQNCDSEEDIGKKRNGQDDGVGKSRNYKLYDPNREK